MLFSAANPLFTRSSRVLSALSATCPPRLGNVHEHDYTYAMTASQPARRARRSDGSKITIVIEIFGILAQLLLVYLGGVYLFNDAEDPFTDGIFLLMWCLVATLYLAGTVFWLNVDLRINQGDPRFLRNVSRSPIIAIFSTVVTFSSSMVGLSAAVVLISESTRTSALHFYEIVAVWAMLGSWAMFQWGYARIYYGAYQARASERPLRFPGTKEPRLVDFVYFSFTNGTSFATSDVVVRTSRMRWTVVWHTTFSFFFNALIIVLTMNTISGGFAIL